MPYAGFGMLVQEQIETESVILSPLSLNDAEEMFPQFTEAVTIYMVPKAAESMKDIAEFIEKSIQQTKEGTDFLYTIRRKRDSLFLGVAGIHEINTNTPVFGIWLREDQHGNGYGKATIHALHRWASSHLNPEYFIYPVDQKNTASLRIPESLGGTVEAAYSKENLSGRTLNILEYHIPPARSGHSA